MQPSQQLQHDALTWRLPALPPAWRWSLLVYLAYRVLISAVAGLVVALLAITQPEQAGPVWPITPTLWAWADRIAIQPFAHYDTGWYTGIAASGYDFMPGATAFHPLFPGLMGFVGRLLGGNYLLGGWLVAQVACLLMLVLLYKLVRLDYDDAVARRATLFLAASPMALCFFVPYTESLLMVGVLAAFYAARRGRWVLTGAAAGMAILTKQPGAALVLPLLWELWRQRGDAIRARRLRPLLAPLAGLGLIALSVATLLLLRLSQSDVVLDLGHPGTLVAGLLVTPNYAAVWDEHFAWPWAGIALAVERLITRPNSYLAINCFGMAAMLGLALHSLRSQRGSYNLYTVTLILLSLSIYYPSSPYMGILRRFTIIFPLFINLALLVRGRRATIWVVLSSLGLLYVTTGYVRNAFLP
jgi:hypothetical protein